MLLIFIPFYSFLVLSYLEELITTFTSLLDVSSMKFHASPSHPTLVSSPVSQDTSCTALLIPLTPSVTSSLGMFPLILKSKVAMVVYSVPSTVTLPLVQVGTSIVHISIVAFSSMTSTTGATTGVSISTVSVDTHAMLRIAVLAIAIVASTFFIWFAPLCFI